MKQEFIQFAPLFAGLTEAERGALSDNFIQGQTAAGAALFKAGEQSDGLYLIGKGFIRLLTPSGINLATLGPGSVLGEDSLFRDLPYDVSAQAVADLEYWKLSDRNLRELIVREPGLGLQLSQNFGSLIAQMQDYLIKQLAKTPELNSLPQHTLQGVADQLQPRRLAAGQYLFRVGDPPSGLFLVESGRLELLMDSSGEKQTVDPGELVGIISLLTNKPHSTSAVAEGETLLWALTAEDFQGLSSRQPGLRRSLGRSVRSRLSRADQSAAVLRLSKMPIFADLPPQTLQAITGRMVLQHVPAGERVYRIGETGDAMYLVDSGEIELTAENAVGVVEEIGRIGSDGYCGEMSLLTGQMRTEDATATRNSNLWVLYKTDLDALAGQYPAIGKAMSQGVASKLSSSGAQDQNKLRQFALFADLGPADLRQVASYLRPMRYRAGEQIVRANTPPDKLFLLERGEVRVQPLAGAPYLLGPGESFGERALLTNQLHNALVTAESDVDVLTLAKSDFDMLMNRFPALAIALSRILSQRLTQATVAAPVAAVAPAPQNLPPPASAPAASSRRRQAAAAAGEAEPVRQRRGFGAWYGNLSGIGKVAFALLILLLILFLCITVPFTILAIMNGPAAASKAAIATLNNAVSAVSAEGSYRVAAAPDRSFLRRLRGGDANVPPTPTYTPYPTNTPLPTSTPLPTATPLPTDTPAPVIAAAVDTAPPPPTDTPTPAAVQAAAAPPRNLDPRLAQLGVGIKDAPAAPGQQYWRVIEARWEDGNQAGGKHHIYVDVLDENGKRLVGQNVTVYWGDGSYTGPTEDKPPPDLGFNYMMYAAGNAYNVKVEGLPSEELDGAGMGDLTNRFKGIHTAFYVIFQRATK